MLEEKNIDKLTFPWEIGLLVVLYLAIVSLPFLNDKTSQVYLFQNNNSIFGGKEFKGLSNSYFKNSFIFRHSGQCRIALGPAVCLQRSRQHVQSSGKLQPGVAHDAGRIVLAAYDERGGAGEAHCRAADRGTVAEPEPGHAAHLHTDATLSS